jgi:hypothetical protein
MHVRRSLSEPLRVNPDWEERWERADKGLINCWECGREMVIGRPEQAGLAIAGELLVLPWRGGVDKKAKKIPKKKTGSLYYLAMWQGLRGEDLDIDTERGALLRCAATGTVVTYQFDVTKIEDEDDAEVSE